MPGRPLPRVALAGRVPFGDARVLGPAPAVRGPDPLVAHWEPRSSRATTSSPSRSPEDGNVEDPRGKLRDCVEAFGVRVDARGKAGGCSFGGDAGVRNHRAARIQDAAGKHGALRKREKLERKETDG